MIAIVPADIDDLLAKVIPFGGTLGGLFLVLRMVMAFQRDFSDRYAGRLAAQEATIDQLHAENDRLRSLLYQANQALVGAGQRPIWEPPPSPPRV